MITKGLRPPPLPALYVTNSNLLDVVTTWVDTVINRLVYLVRHSPKNVNNRSFSHSLKPTAAAMSYFDPLFIYNKNMRFKVIAVSILVVVPLVAIPRFLL